MSDTTIEGEAPTMRDDDLVERLRATFTVRDEFSTCHPLVNPDGPKAADRIQALAEENAALLDRLAAAEAEIEQVKTVLADPAAVHMNMLRGGIARPSIASIIHIYGETSVRAALRDGAGDRG